MSPPTPTSDDLRAIVREALGLELLSAARFPTGLCHYVYDAVLADGRSVVLRLAKPQNQHYLAGAVHWSGVLASIGLPLPKLLHAQLTPGQTPYPYIVLERLPGNDLGEVYPHLSAKQKQTLARTLAAMQDSVGKLPEAAGFGFQTDPQRPPPFPTWADAVEAGIQRSQRWIEQAGVVDGRRAQSLRDAAHRLASYFREIPPKPFLDDITTKNVLIHDGQLTGIVDVDMMCFGDRVAHLGLTRMALLAREFSTDYIDYWCDALRLGEIQRRALEFYTAESCLSFLGEQGQSFNQEKPSPVDRAQVTRLEKTFDELLARLK
jgi:aminoglycoside phosphotransferase (APT) family kinase protein